MKSIRHLSTRTLAISAVATLSAFPCLVVGANLVQRDSYSAARQAVSNLALGRAGWLMTVAFLCLGLGTFLLAVIVRRMVARAIIGPALLAGGACTTFLSAALQTDAEGATPTLHGTIHIALGLGTFTLVVAAITACAVAFLRSDSRRGIGIVSAVWALAAIGAVVMTSILPESLFGVGQRIFLTVAIAWMLMICVVAIQGGRVRRGSYESMAVAAAGPRIDASA